jgi:type III restriction enzyme
MVRAQIKETIATHMRRQEELRARGIKVLSLFFVDRESHFLDEKDGYIRQIFDDEMAKAIRKEPSLKGRKPADLRIHYFASVKNRKKGGSETEIFLDRIGRGLRLPIDQTGSRIFDGAVNILTVIAAESYAGFASALQKDYAEDGQTDRVPVGNARRSPIRPNPKVFESPRFRQFTKLLATPAHYEIKFSSQEFLDLALERIRSSFEIPLPRIELRKGGFDFIRVDLRFVEGLVRDDTLDWIQPAKNEYRIGDHL